MRYLVVLIIMEKEGFIIRGMKKFAEYNISVNMYSLAKWIRENSNTDMLSGMLLKV